jgi:hypothetical protein
VAAVLYEVSAGVDVEYVCTGIAYDIEESSTAERYVYANDS